MIYLDNNATTRPAPEAVAAVREALETAWANPSSIHRAGQAARRLVERSRQSVARLIGAEPREITFTSGATESIDLAIRGVLAAAPESKRVIVTTAIEHEAAREVCRVLAEEPRARAELRQLPLDRAGRVRTEAMGAMLDESVALVSVQWANNETGVIQPVDEIGRACRAGRIPFHCDGTQWVGKMPTLVDAADPGGAPIDLLSFSAHKMHGPKGVGALYVRRGVRLVPRIRGVQERERRGGTENVPGIAGFGAAAELAMSWLADARARTRLGALRDRLERGVLSAVPGAVVNGVAEEASVSGHQSEGENAPCARLWNTTNIAFPRLEAEALLLLLSESPGGGVCASAGAACSSGSLDPSPVLLAMDVPPELAHGSVRFSLSRETTAEEIERAIEAIVVCASRLRGSSAAAIEETR